MTGEPVITEDTGFQTGRVATIAGGHAVHDTFTAFLPPLLPRFIEGFSLSNTAAGTLSAFLQIPSLLQPVIGHLADRTTLRWIVVLAPGVTATAMSVLGWAPGYAVLAILLLIAGLSVAAFHATAPVAVGYLSGRKLGRGMGFWMVGGELGRTLGPLVVVSALAIMSLETMALLAVAGIGTSVILHFRLRSVPLRTKSDGEQIPWRTAVLAMRGVMGLLASLIAVRSLMMMSVTIFLPVFLTEDELAHIVELFQLGELDLWAKVFAHQVLDRLHALLVPGLVDHRADRAKAGKQPHLDPEIVLGRPDMQFARLRRLRLDLGRCCGGACFFDILRGQRLCHQRQCGRRCGRKSRPVHVVKVPLNPIRARCPVELRISRASM